MPRDIVTAVLQRDTQLNELTAENDKLRVLLQKLLRHRFGRRSEQLSPDQLKLAIKDIEQEIAEREAAEEAAEPSEDIRRRRRRGGKIVPRVALEARVLKAAVAAGFETPI